MYDFGDAVSAGSTIAIDYSAAAGTLEYLLGTKVIGTQTGVTAVQIAGLRDVSFGFASNDTSGDFTSTVQSFTLTESQPVPEPAATRAAALGLAGLMGLEMRRRRRLAAY